MGYDSRPDTYVHSLRVGTLLGQLIKDLVDRSTRHDLTKTEPPELSVYDTYTPLLEESTFGSDEYQAHLAAMGDALQHHYHHNRHHPQYHRGGVDGMTLADVMEMIADWKAATERNPGGDLARSLDVNRVRFEISDQLVQILWNTAREYGWLEAVCDNINRDHGYVCDALLDGPGWHWGPHLSHRRDSGTETWWGTGTRTPTDHTAATTASAGPSGS